MKKYLSHNGVALHKFVDAVVRPICASFSINWVDWLNAKVAGAAIHQCHTQHALVIELLMLAKAQSQIPRRNVAAKGGSYQQLGHSSVGTATDAECNVLLDAKVV